MPRRRIKFHDSPGFGTIQVDQSYADKDAAYELLKKVTTDEAILKVMEKHKWQVPKVIEITPISHRNLLGYNENAGFFFCFESLLTLRIKINFSLVCWVCFFLTFFQSKKKRFRPTKISDWAFKQQCFSLKTRISFL